MARTTRTTVTMDEVEYALKEEKYFEYLDWYDDMVSNAYQEGDENPEETYGERLSFEDFCKIN